MDFKDIKFRGTFREYQQRVIDNSDKYLKKDKKIHIVAAPGSGKTILGLELVRRLGQPALVLSPTIAIREQWKDRFAEMFVPEGGDVNNFVSCDLKKPKLLTSITYQGLYSSYRKLEKVPKKELSEETGAGEATDEAADEVIENYSSINIVELMKEKKISVLCLDEAHHLRAEWQKALYEFVARVEHSVIIIALTATPPYDSKRSEWDKYVSMCGPIDEEIFVPELVRAKTLCPHQDFIYYNFPTEDELKVIERYRAKVDQTVQGILSDGVFANIITQSKFYTNTDEFEDELSDRTYLLRAMLSFFNECKITPPKQLLRIMEKRERDVKWDLSVAEVLFQGMISDDVLFSAKDQDTVLSYLSRAGLIEKRQVKLLTNDEVEKLLFTSIGKLNSINRIVKEEFNNLGDKIRLLVLTDYIRVNSDVLGNPDKEIKEMGVVPIFELLRRSDYGIKLAAISGKIVIVPNEAVEAITQIAAKDKAIIRAVAIKGTQHSELKFDGANRAQKISVITKAFNEGIVNGIVGTKSLLGEGWDSPVINTLILASFVGSFMLSNQMRGRAIRIDKLVPEKVSNIWHLTAILPEHLLPDVASDIPSADYQAISRRFKSFMGLGYEKDIIENSLSRALTIEPPYNEQNVNKANQKSFEIAAERGKTAQRWQNALSQASNEVVIQNEIPKPKRGFFPAFILKPSHFGTIKKITYAVLKTFKELKLLNKKAKALIEKDYKAETVNVGLTRCSKHEKTIFHAAIAEVFGVIDSPKYVLIKTRGTKPDYRTAFAVPEIFSNKKENAEVFCERMSRRIANFGLYFTRSEDGKKTLALARKKAYVNKTSIEIAARMKLRPNN